MMSSVNYAVLAVAVFSLIAGIGIYLHASSRRPAGAHRTTILIAWLLISLFPVIVLFSFFPSSNFSGGVKGVSFTGAIGAFAFLFVYGSRKAVEAQDLDARERDLTALESELEADKARNEPRVLARRERVLFKVLAARGRRSRFVGIIAGNLQEVTDVDAWVNSENTEMQMASYYDRSASGLIRYLGSQRDPKTNRVTEDLIGNALAARMGSDHEVKPASVLSTTSGELRRRNNVKVLLHVAAVQGEPGRGYRPVQDLPRCVTAVLEALDRRAPDEEPVQSVVFPLLGAGQARGEVRATVETLISAALDYVQTHPDSPTSTVYFMAYTGEERAELLRYLDGDPRCERTRATLTQRVRR